MNISIKRISEIIKEDGILSLLKKVLYYTKLGIFGPILLKKAIRKFHLSIMNKQSIEDLIDIVNSFNYHNISITPIQNKDEILSLLKIIKETKPKIILEIGTANGGTLFLFSNIADSDTTLISIDLPGTRFSRSPQWKHPLFTSFAKKQQKIFLINSDSHNNNTLSRIKEIILERKIDFLFIDGDHSYDGVAKDFEMYGPLVGADKIIAFHDIVPGPSEFVGGVPTFWEQIKKEYKYDEFVDNWNQQSCGIGILYK